MRALVLSGGGANGAFEVGALSHILGVRKVHYDLIAGVSVGALNGAFLAQYPNGEEVRAAAGLEAMWDQIKGDGSIFKKWYLGLLPAPVPFFFKWKPSVYNTEPVRKLVRKHLSPNLMLASGKTFVCGAIAWSDTSEYRLWDQTSEDIVEAVLASSSFPVFFEPIRIRGVQYTDGGLRDTTPIKAAIERGATHIDIIQCSPSKLLSLKGLALGLDQVKRAINITLNEVDNGDYEAAQMINKLIQCGCAPNPKLKLVTLNRIQPKEDLGDSLDFSPKKARRLRDAGKQVAMESDDLWV